VADPIANVPPVSAFAPPPAGRHHTTQFDTVMRGYDRRQVDKALANKDKTIGQLEIELAETKTRLTAAAENAAYLANELQTRQASALDVAAQPADEGFGLRAEKLLRLAEQEAVEMRSQASADCTAIIEQARNEAEKLRHEVEQDLIARRASLEEQATRRASELQVREQQIADQLSSARMQAEQLHTTATRAADRLREEAAATAEETRVRAENTAKRMVEQATHEVTRLTRLQDSVRSELHHLTQVLTNEQNAAPAAEQR
jgi:cell division septum initiation protein DivIVA